MNEKQQDESLAARLKKAVDYLEWRIDNGTAKAADLTVYRKVVMDYHEAKLKEEQATRSTPFMSGLRIAVDNDAPEESS